MRVLIIPEQFPTDENPTAGIFIKDQIKAISSFADVTVFNSNPWYRGNYLYSKDARYFDLHLFENKWKPPLNRLAYAWWERMSFRMGRRLPRPDLIHLHGASLRGPWVRRLADHWRIPFVTTEHTGPWSAIANRKPVWKRAKSVMEDAAAVLPVSRHLEEEIRASGIFPKRSEVLGNPVDTEFFTLRNKPLSAEKVILFLGRLDDFKGGLRTLKAFESVKDELADYKLVIAGTGAESNSINSFIIRYGLEDQVEFLNRNLDRGEMLFLFHRASFLVFPSLFESFGLVAAEALSTGLPLVVTDRTGPRDFSNENNSIAVNPENYEDIARGMQIMTANLDGYSPVAIHDELEKGLGLNRYSARLEGLYGEVLE